MFDWSARMTPQKVMIAAKYVKDREGHEEDIALPKKVGSHVSYGKFKIKMNF
jgi:hypothetical protein